MAGWNLQIELIDETFIKTDEGSYEEQRESKTVWANPMTLGASTWLAARSSGLHADAQVKVHAFEYDGQECVRIGNTEYNVEKAQSAGELVSLTLSKRAKNDVS